MKYADLGKRFLAYLIDVGILLGLYFAFALVIGIAFAVILSILGNSQSDAAAGIASLALLCFIMLLLLFTFGMVFYFWIWRPYKHNGQSIGKQMMHIRIIRATDKPLTLGSYFGRYAIFYILGILSVITLFFDEEKRAIHDMVVDTRVVEE